MDRMANPHVWVKPERPVPPERVLEVPGRTAFDGSVLSDLDEETVRSAAERFRSEDIGSIAVSLNHSYANPSHERRARELVLEGLPNAHLSLSSEVLPVFREYERTITTVLNAYVMPRVSGYIENLDRELRALGVEAPLLIMKSNGGVIGADTAIRQPVYTALSGPAAGVMSAIDVARSTVEEARGTDHTPVLAEALESLGRLQSMGVSAAEAEATLQEAILVAAQAKDDSIAPRA